MGYGRVPRIIWRRSELTSLRRAAETVCKAEAIDISQGPCDHHQNLSRRRGNAKRDARLISSRLRVFASIFATKCFFSVPLELQS